MPIPLAPDAPVIFSVFLLALLDFKIGHAMSREETLHDGREKEIAYNDDLTLKAEEVHQMVSLRNWDRHDCGLIDRLMILREEGLIRIAVENGGVRECEGEKHTRILKETLCRA